MTDKGLPPLILVVEDEEDMREVLAQMLAKPGWRVQTAPDGVEALQRLRAERPAVLLTDLNMPRMDGMALLREVNAAFPGLPVVVLTAYGSVPGAVEAMHAGAFDFLSKPVSDPAGLRAVIRRALEASSPDLGASEADPICEDPASEEVLAAARAVASRPTTVLLTGESGVGKEVVSRFLHRHSDRAAGPFVALNCAALPETLLESELFGHEKGAFTGAVRTHPGRFEQADGGTLLLDEVGEMAPALQAKFLRVLETRKVTRLGATRELPVDVRVLAATNRDLHAEVQERRFREDLYFRLSVFPIHIPPLRERRGDILPLARHFLAVLGTGPGRRPLELLPEAATALHDYDWPGNVRELSNVMERAVIMAGSGDIRASHLRLGGQVAGAAPASAPVLVPAPAESADAPSDEQQPPKATNLKELEKRAILVALESTGGNRRHAAKLLGIARRTLQYKLKKYDIE